MATKKLPEEKARKGSKVTGTRKQRANKVAGQGRRQARLDVKKRKKTGAKTPGSERSAVVGGKARTKALKSGATKKEAKKVGKAAAKADSKAFHAKGKAAWKGAKAAKKTYKKNPTASNRAKLVKAKTAKKAHNRAAKIRTGGPGHGARGY